MGYNERHFEALFNQQNVDIQVEPDGLGGLRFTHAENTLVVSADKLSRAYNNLYGNDQFVNTASGWGLLNLC